MAEHDPLTNLFNRRRFRDELKHQVALSKRYGNKGALLFLDLDNFKYYNDTYGHLKGDKLRLELSGILRKGLRGTDILARLGGDEFAIILPYADKDKALSISSHLLEPVVEVKNNILHSYEVLLRMIGEAGEHILPNEFLATAERFGHIRAIDRWVVSKSIRLMAEYELDKKGNCLGCLGINLSGKAFTDPELTHIIKDELSAKGMVNKKAVPFSEDLFVKMER
ncbi:MAG: diguanylate cyclase [Candidatus Brocadiaceae bacterium]|nr:diguanylate cyclase [Candidatus Brocadiaceae bacterium]